MPEPDWRHPSPRLWIARQLQLGAVVLVGLAAAGSAGGLAFGSSGAIGGLCGVAVLGGLGWLALRGRVLAWGYAEREEDLLVTRGLLVRRMSVVPYGRMQYVDVTAGPLERAFGLASVRMHTAAAASDARIPGVTALEAERLRDRLAADGQARAMGL
ncbi:MAG TPA: PH domain-containing protein [Mycobacteriales bacterium]|nr:PH domain-containing protein [Mycobacteriales bacterium]